MLVLITYDVKTESAAGRRRLRRIAQACQDFGQWVQYSVFECDVDPATWTSLRARLLSEYNETEDSLQSIIWDQTGSAVSSITAQNLQLILTEY